MLALHEAITPAGTKKRHPMLRNTVVGGTAHPKLAGQVNIWPAERHELEGADDLPS